MTPQRTRRQFVQLGLAASLLPLPRIARASTGRVFFGYPPGSVATPLMELLLPQLAGRYQPTLDAKMTYLPGNVGARSFEAVHKGADDGSNVVLAPSSALSLNPMLRPVAGRDPMVDFKPVLPILEFAFAFCVSKAVPGEVKTLADYARWVQENPTKNSYCLPGMGTSPHLMVQRMARALGLNLRAIAYQGARPVIKELASGNQPAGTVLIGSANEEFGSGSIRALFVGSARRWAGMPEVPTLVELTNVDGVMSETFGLHVRASVPDAKVQQLGEACRQALQGAALQAFAAATWTVVRSDSTAAYAAELAAERRMYTQTVAREQFSIDG